MGYSGDWLQTLKHSTYLIFFFFKSATWNKISARRHPLWMNGKAKSSIDTGETGQPGTAREPQNAKLQHGVQNPALINQGTSGNTEKKLTSGEPKPAKF